MKILGLLLLLVLFTGITTKNKTISFLVPLSQEEIVKRKELKLELTKSEVVVKIAEIKYQKNID